ncbi:hypothetical protein L1275_001268 [Flavobacterium sp. HSC-61S13]|nr:hypothetical protein [Flavobacterium sp. HSC-61S13]
MWSEKLTIADESRFSTNESRISNEQLEGSSL